MLDLTSDSSDDDDNMYLNAAARLKALKKKNASTMVVEDSPKSERVFRVSPQIRKTSPRSQEVSQQSQRDLSSVNTVSSPSGRFVICGKDVSINNPVQINDNVPNAPVSSIVDGSSKVVDLSREDSPKSQDLSLNDEIASIKDYVRDVSLKIKWKSREIRVFKVKENETFEKVFQDLADNEGVLKKQIYITKDNRQIFSTDTPVSINLSIIDILEGGIVSKEIALEDSELESNDVDENVCRIKVQTSTKQKINVTLRNFETFEKVISACSEQLNVPPERMKLSFDGDEIKPSDTPESMEIEEEACIDLRIVPL